MCAKRKLLTRLALMTSVTNELADANHEDHRNERRNMKAEGRMVAVKEGYQHPRQN